MHRAPGSAKVRYNCPKIDGKAPNCDRGVRGCLTKSMHRTRGSAKAQYCYPRIAGKTPNCGSGVRRCVLKSMLSARGVLSEGRGQKGQIEAVASEGASQNPCTGLGEAPKCDSVVPMSASKRQTAMGWPKIDPQAGERQSVIVLCQSRCQNAKLR